MFEKIANTAKENGITNYEVYYDENALYIRDKDYISEPKKVSDIKSIQIETFVNQNMIGIILIRNVYIKDDNDEEIYHDNNTELMDSNFYSYEEIKERASSVFKVSKANIEIN